MQYSVPVRNAKLNAIEAIVGPSPILKVFDGAKPANCAAADAGTVISTIQLPPDWMADAANGSKAKSGTWQDAAADANGEAKYFRIYDQTGANCGIQGTCGLLAADMLMDSIQFTAGQNFTVIGFTISDNNG
jgi:hypothetical protein